MSEILPRAHLYPHFHEVDTLSYGLRYGLVGLGAGTFSACMKNAYFSTTASPWSVISIYGGTIPIYAAAFGSYGFTKGFMQNFRRTNDGWNDFAGGVTGGIVWGAFRRQPISTIVLAAAFAGTSLGIFAWSGGLGGLSTIAGVDIREALEYRRKWRFYPTSLMPLEDYERAIGRKAHPEDFADIDAIMGENRFEAMDTPTDAVSIVPPKKPNQQWWKDVLEKTSGKGEGN